MCPAHFKNFFFDGWSAQPCFSLLIYPLMWVELGESSRCTDHCWIWSRCTEPIVHVTRDINEARCLTTLESMSGVCCHYRILLLIISIMHCYQFFEQTPRNCCSFDVFTVKQCLDFFVCCFSAPWLEQWKRMVVKGYCALELWWGS